MEMVECPEEAILGRTDLDKSLALPLQIQWFSNLIFTESSGVSVWHEEYKTFLLDFHSVVLDWGSGILTPNILTWWRNDHHILRNLLMTLVFHGLCSALYLRTKRIFQEAPSLFLLWELPTIRGNIGRKFSPFHLGILFTVMINLYTCLQNILEYSSALGYFVCNYLEVTQL